MKTSLDTLSAAGVALSGAQLGQVSGGYLPSTVLDIVVKIVVATPN